MATDEPGLPTASADEIVYPETVASSPRARWRLGLGLLAFSMLGSAAILPFAISVMRQAKGVTITSAMIPTIVAVTLFFEGFISLVTIAIGVGLGRRTGLGPFLLEGIDGGPGSDEIAIDGPSSPSRRAWRAVGLAAVIGTVLGGLVIGLSYAFESLLPKLDFKAPTLLEGFLASIGAGIREEVWLRLGLMTLLAWLVTVIARREAGNSAIIWSANVLAALAFAAIHLPQASMLLGLNVAVVAFVFIGNGVPGIAFGWLFWRKGLIAAMVAHFMFDIALKVIAPAIET